MCIHVPFSDFERQSKNGSGNENNIMILSRISWKKIWIFHWSPKNVKEDLFFWWNEAFQWIQHTPKPWRHSWKLCNFNLYVKKRNQYHRGWNFACKRTSKIRWIMIGSKSYKWFFFLIPNNPEIDFLYFVLNKIAYKMN